MGIPMEVVLSNFEWTCVGPWLLGEFACIGCCVGRVLCSSAETSPASRNVVCGSVLERQFDLGVALHCMIHGDDPAILAVHDQENSPRIAGKEVK